MQGIPMVASSPVRHESPLGMNPIEVHSYQPPWKALSDFALHTDLDRLDPSAAPFQHLVSQVCQLHIFLPSLTGVLRCGLINEPRSRFNNTACSSRHPASTKSMASHLYILHFQLVGIPILRAVAIPAANISHLIKTPASPNPISKSFVIENQVMR